MATIKNKEEYLKRYLTADDVKKKKVLKKKSTPVGLKNVKKSRIVDDDLDLRMIENNDESYVEIGEEAPEVIGIVDDRPEELRRLEEMKEGKWKMVGGDETNLIELVSNKWGLPNSFKPLTGERCSTKPLRLRHDSDQSPERPLTTERTSQSKRFRKKISNDPESDISRLRSGVASNAKMLNSDSEKSKIRNDSDSESSSRSLAKVTAKSAILNTRRARHDSDSDLSPTRGPEKHGLLNSDSDLSPPRVREKHDLLNSDSDLSPPRTRADKSDSDFCPVRPRAASPSTSSDQSPTRENMHASISPDKSPKPRLRDENLNLRRSNKTKRKDEDESSRKHQSGRYSKLDKTLDGKLAGLQSAKSLRKENEAFKEREKQQFEKMDHSLSGRDAQTILRDRTTGKIRNLEEEKKQQALENEIKAKREAKYQEWGQGLKQKELQKVKLEEDMHEINKPLARYKNDIDLDKMLREQEREGDPMLAFIQQKKKSKDGVSSQCKYNGPVPPPPNRFDILPGYRWDGVDRSNGYEKGRYARLNNKIALQDEAYKWSVEDM